VRGEEIVQGAEYVYSCAEWRMVLVDLRNHGRSAGIKGIVPPHDLSTAAKDLADLVKARGWAWPDVVVGHSMGAKVALDYAESCSHGVYGELAVLPKQVPAISASFGSLFLHICSNKVFSHYFYFGRGNMSRRISPISFTEVFSSLRITLNIACNSEIT
jgi:hypothetical protein